MDKWISFYDPIDYSVKKNLMKNTVEYYKKY